MSGNEMMRTEKLSVGYNGNAIVDDINISLETGKIMTLIGPNGVGKTTLIKTLSGIIKPVNGMVYINNESLSNMNDRVRARSIASVLTSKDNAELMSVYEMVSMGRYPYTGTMGLLVDEDKKKVEMAMELTDVLAFKDEEFSKLSDGQKQRVLLARAICQEPLLLILDEPTSFLDIKYKMEFLTLLKRLSKEMSFSVVLSLHELDMAKQISDTIVCIKKSKIDRVGTADEIYSGGYIGELFDIQVGNYDENTGLGIIDGI